MFYSAALVAPLATVAAVTHNTDALLWLAGVVAALGVVWRGLRFGRALRRLKDFGSAWFGEPEAPGVERRPGLPETVAAMAKQVQEMSARDNGLTDFMGQVVQRLEENGRKADLLDAKVDRVDTRVVDLDHRVTDHRRRNEEQASVLRSELEKRANAIEQKLHERNEAVDDRLNHISEDLMRAETMRAALTELGLEVDPPERP